MRSKAWEQDLVARPDAGSILLRLGNRYFISIFRYITSVLMVYFVP
jgi:hypothetical protein